MRLLLIEDNLRLSHLTAAGLQKAGFAIDTCATALDAELALHAVDYDLAIVDLGLPDSDGMDLLKALRRERQSIPILIVTARDGLKDRVAGLDAGADDYMVKPFSMEELIARVRALLRRPAIALADVLTVGNVGLDPNRRAVAVAGELIAMTRREFDVMELLIRNRGKVVSKTSIDEKVYGFDEDVSLNSVEVIISRLRRRLREAHADVNIVTIRGVGYLVGDARP